MRLEGMALQSVAPGQTGSNDHATAKDARLAKSAHEFEASLMSELLKPLQQSNGLTGEEDGEGSGGALAGFASESLARAISDKGGFGIADKVLRELHRGSDASGVRPSSHDRQMIR